MQWQPPETAWPTPTEKPMTTHYDPEHEVRPIGPVSLVVSLAPLAALVALAVAALASVIL